MSRIGKLPIHIPSGVKVRQEGRKVRIEGPRGAEEHELPQGISVEQADGTLRVLRTNDERQTKALHGLTRKLLANIVTGVSRGFTKTLEIVGVGYRAEMKGDALHLSLGYSHPIAFPLPQGVRAKVERQTVVTLEANNRHLVGQTAAQIRGLRSPEPYKGKGIKYADETIRRKAGKAAGAGTR
jgi:large subunit ribosomal protein L6